jgi:hypothetical protein
MNDLDNKLRDIHTYYFDPKTNEDIPLPPFSDTIIAQVKQVFADEGYRVAGRHEAINQRLREKVASGEIMRGEEWYDRFEKLWAETYQDTFMVPKDTIFQAAKKAAGIE